MIRAPLPDIISRIREKTGLSEQDVLKKIDDKCTSLSGLISKEGAAHIIANELGVKLHEQSGKIKDLLPGARSVEVIGRITQIYEVRSFQRADGSAGKVGSFLVGDDTGVVRIVCWGDKADVLSQLTLNQGVKIINGMVRENQRGYKEVHLNDHSKVVPATVDLPPAKTIERKPLRDLRESEEQVEILGTIVQVFDPKFFEVCPQCNTRLKDASGQWACDQHGTVEPDYGYLVNIFVDDGTENMRVVLFRNQAEKLLNKTKDEIVSYRIAPDAFEPLKTDLLGEQFVFVGKARKNTFFDRLEFMANQVHKADPEAELKRLEQQS